MRPADRPRFVAATAAALFAIALAASAVATAGPAKPKDAKPADKPKADAKTAPAPAAAPRVDTPDTRKYPTNRAAELKARLLERPKDPAAAAWAVEYAGTPEVARLDPVTRAAEQAWAARTGLASGPATAERPALEAILSQVGSCPLDSVPVKRAAEGLTRIGVVVPLSGKYERFGRTFVNGLRVAMEEHNRDWAPRLSLILHDSEGDPLVGARKARWLLKDHGVSLLVGEILSANTAPLAAATQVTDAVLISPSATNERLAILGDGVFQLHIGTKPLAESLARQLATESPNSSVGILVAKTHDDSLLAAAVARSCDNAAVRVMGTERVRDGDADLTKELTKLRDRKPTALVLIGSQQFVGLSGAQLRSIWPDAHVLGFQSMDPEPLNEESRQGLEGAILFMSEYALDGDPKTAFEAAYRRVNKEPPTRMSVRGYLTGLAIARAIESGAFTAAQLKEALRAQAYDDDEERALRSLKPAVAAFPERLTIKNGKAVPLAQAPVDP
ncbi:MAG TPA: ABC transporter substrate-binding protein [Candidatus Eisenbacteria bacterium]|jgi:ABC-type branched-subunit amino acid transport system substrate-binding protein|nr:ABC transporter substrate-binding protein [Candidatus Eisenbacteria bacterium]